ncbi:hypothetical protein GCM10009759_00870 [Kitasatospora saccharophila]|uniref:Uncharacterized protein n=1 Tax=Kitasatospora saccharophila TaxID=407973 RepID=A0ABN2W4W7_9ACTN
MTGRRKGRSACAPSNLRAAGPSRPARAAPTRPERERWAAGAVQAGTVKAGAVEVGGAAAPGVGRPGARARTAAAVPTGTFAGSRPAARPRGSAGRPGTVGAYAADSYYG